MSSTSKAIVTHASKILLASILETYEIRKKIRAKVYILKTFLPSVETQWDDLTTVMNLCVNNEVALTASLSKNSEIPDETRVPSSISISGETIEHMHAVATALSLTMSSSYEFTYEEIGTRKDYTKATGTWGSIARQYKGIVSLIREYSTFAGFASDCYWSPAAIAAESRTPGQLALFSNVGFVWESDEPHQEYISLTAIENAIGNEEYITWATKSTSTLLSVDPPNLQFVQHKYIGYVDDKIQGVAEPPDDEGYYVDLSSVSFICGLRCASENSTTNDTFDTATGTYGWYNLGSPTASAGFFCPCDFPDLYPTVTDKFCIAFKGTLEADEFVEYLVVTLEVVT